MARLSSLYSSASYWYWHRSASFTSSRSTASTVSAVPDSCLAEGRFSFYQNTVGARTEMFFPANGKGVGRLLPHFASFCPSLIEHTSMATQRPSLLFVVRLAFPCNLTKGLSCLFCGGTLQRRLLSEQKQKKWTILAPSATFLVKQ